MRRTLRRKLSLAFAALALGALGCDVCGLVDQEIVVAVDDPELGGLIGDCRNGVPPATEPMCEEPPGSVSKISCACLPLCRRVYAIVYADPRRPPLERCGFRVDEQGAARISIEYRSVCQ